jgi:HSP20 family protein
MKNKIIYILIFVIGGLVFATGTKLYLSSQKQQEQVALGAPKHKKSFFERFFDDGFFNDEGMDKMIHSFQDLSGRMDVGRLEVLEDDRYITYKINIDQVDKNSLKVDIKDGQVTLRGESKVESENKGSFGSSKRLSISSFTRSFPIPRGVKPEEVKIENAQDGLLLKFPKTSKI